MERLKIFISSVQRDLQAERDAAEAVVGRLGHDCVRAETQDSPGATPKTTCEQMAAECDIYVGILGGTYGQQDPGIGMSITEYEYRQAHARAPDKVFIYVKDVQSVEPKQERFLREVQDFATGYFRHRKFTDCEQLSEQLHRDITTWTTQRVRQARSSERENMALLDKMAYYRRVMKEYGIPEELQ
jgi:hypothetical protein